MTKISLLTGHLPMKPFLATFIRKKENLLDGHALMIPGDSVIGSTLDMLLLNKTALRDDRRDSLPDVYSDSIKFAIQDSRVTWGDMFITNTRIIRFNSIVNGIMYELLFHDILRALEEGREEKEEIYKFINRYEIYEVNFDTLKKASLRWREKKGFPLFRQKKSQKKGHNRLGNCPALPHGVPAFASA